jgi:ankyrin repeat protein
MLSTCLEEPFAHGQSSFGSVSTSGMKIRQELSMTAASPDSSFLWIQSARTAVSQWTASCDDGSGTSLNATATDSQKEKITSEIQSADLAEQVNFAAFENALNDAVALYRIENYHDARLGFLDVINMVRGLSPLILGNYDFFDIAYMHAVAAYNSTDYISARQVLMDFVLKQATTRSQKLCSAHVSSLLALVNIELGELRAARIACEQAVQLCCSINSKEEKILDDLIALSARVETLLGNHARMKALINMLDSRRQVQLTGFCARYPHRQGLRVEERCAIARAEADLFANVRICEHTGIATILVARERVWAGTSLIRRFGGRSKSRTWGITDLHLASLFGNAEEALALIDHGANVDAEAHVVGFRHLQWAAEYPLTPLACALLLRHGNLVRLLVSKGAKLTNSGGTCVVFAIMNEAFVRGDGHSFREMLEILKLLGWDINSPVGSKRRTLLHVAARLSKTAHVRTLVSCGASVTAEDQRGNIPLEAALRRWRRGSKVPEIVQTLLQQQMQEQLMSRNHCGMTVLHIIVYGHHPLEQTVLFLLRAGADPYAVDDLGRSPFNWLQGRWDWTGVSKFLTQNRSETPLASCLDSPEIGIGQIEAAGQFLDAIT